MTWVPAGSRVLIKGSGASVAVRSLRSANLEGGWSFTVLGDTAALEAAGVRGERVEAQIQTQSGVVRVDAELVTGDGVFLLRAPGLRVAAIVEQRRENVRARVSLPLRGTLLAAGSRAARRDRGPQIAGDVGIVLNGDTRSVSSGGISLELQSGRPVAVGATIYVELEMPAGDLAPAVATVVSSDGPVVRARFVDISPLDRERLVRLVFATQRAELAERRQRVDSDR